MPMAEEHSKDPGQEEESGSGGAEQAEPGAQEPGPGRTASADLADGLELMLRAARKAMRGIDPGRIEELGRRAVQSVENLDRRKVGEIGRKAARNLDPRRIEEIAEDAGRELLGVVERVAERVESVVGGAQRASRPAAGEAAADAAKSDSDANSGDSDAAEAPRPRVRVDDSDK